VIIVITTKETETPIEPIDDTTGKSCNVESQSSERINCSKAYGVSGSYACRYQTYKKGHRKDATNFGEFSVKYRENEGDLLITPIENVTIAGQQQGQYQGQYAPSQSQFPPSSFPSGPPQRSSGPPSKMEIPLFTQKHAAGFCLKESLAITENIFGMGLPSKTRIVGNDCDDILNDVIGKPLSSSEVFGAKKDARVKMREKAIDIKEHPEKYEPKDKPEDE